MAGGPILSAAHHLYFISTKGPAELLCQMYVSCDVLANQSPKKQGSCMSRSLKHQRPIPPGTIPSVNLRALANLFHVGAGGVI